MTTFPPTHDAPPVAPETPFADIPFPSDELSVGRLRALFPNQFEFEYEGGYGTFFIPTTDPDLYETKNAHLLSLARMLSAERVVAQAARDEAAGYDARYDVNWRTERRLAREALAELYVQFKLADGPETARVRIDRIEADTVLRAGRDAEPGR